MTIELLLDENWLYSSVLLYKSEAKQVMEV